MSKLVLNEFKKLFAKKSIYIIFIVVILLLLGINILNKLVLNFVYDEFGMFDKSRTIEQLEEELKAIETAGFKDKLYDEDEWRYIKFDIEQKKFIEMLNEDEAHSWKINLLYPDSEIFPLQREYFDLELQAAQGNYKILDSTEYKKVKEEYEKSLKEFALMTEEEFIEKSLKDKQEIIKQTNIGLAELEKEIGNIEDDRYLLQQIEDLKYTIKITEHDIEILNIRKDKNISYSWNSYMNQALNEYDFLKFNFDVNDKPTEDKDKMTKREYYYNLKNLNESKYILDTGHEINNPNTGNKSLSTFLSGYIVLYLVIIIVIAGTIVAEEYSKGTIKNLLVVPYKRSTILLSKLITIIIMSVITFVVLFLAQVVISGLMYDFNTMLDPVVFYNVNAGSIQKYNLFYYVIKEFIYTLPYILVFTLFSFAVSTLTTSSAAAITLGITSVFATDIVNQLILYAEKDWIKYIPTINWNWSAFNSQEYLLSSSIDPNIAIPITIATLLIFLIPTFMVFKRRDIKNI